MVTRALGRLERLWSGGRLGLAHALARAGVAGDTGPLLRLAAHLDPRAFDAIGRRRRLELVLSAFRRGRRPPNALVEPLCGSDDDDGLVVSALVEDRQAVLEAITRVLTRHGLEPPPRASGDDVVGQLGHPDVEPVHGPLVTVAMTARDAAATIEQAVASVLRQSWRSLELFVVDDASRDGTARILEGVAARDPRVTVLRNRRNVGTYGSKNRVLERAKGDFFTCHDADDWSHPRKIERQVGALAHGETVASLGRWIRLDEAGLPRTGFGGRIWHRNLSSLLFRTDTVRDRLGYYDRVRIEADAEMLARIRATFGEGSVRELDEPASVARLSRGSLTGRRETHKEAPARLAYRQAWRAWHRSGDPLFVPCRPTSRPFPAADLVAVSDDEIRAAFDR